MNANKELQVWIEDRLDYNITENENNISLVRSKNGDWTRPGENACTLVDDGNGVDITLGHRSLNLEYYEALELLIILLKSNDSKIEFVKSKTIKTICP
jgi:hypothetical protein